MSDIVPELLNKIEDDFFKTYRNSQKIKSLLEKLKTTGGYQDAHEYALEVGSILSNSLGNVITAEILPDGRMYYNIADRILNQTLGTNHALIADITEEVQTRINREYGLGIKAIRPQFAKDRVNGIIDRVSFELDFDEISWILQEPIQTFSEKIVDDSIKLNAEFQSRSGLSPKIVRTAEAGCCEWCSEIAGTYIYPDEVPDDVYRRHSNCRCVTEFVSVAKKQNVWTKR